MTLTKSDSEIRKLRVAGKNLAGVLAELVAAAKPGMTTRDFDTIATMLIREHGDEPAFIGYQPWGATYPFPAALCISVNDEVVHGIPGSRVIAEGDLVKFDLGLIHDGLYVDAARAVIIGGEGDSNAKRLIDVTTKALMAGIDACRAGAKTGDVGAAIEAVIKPSGFGIVEELGGHGVGHAVHEEPYIANFGEPGRGKVLKAGMVLAIEPIVTEGSRQVYVSDDGYTFMTRDGKRACQVEHTILVTDGAPEILTKLEK